MSALSLRPQASDRRIARIEIQRISPSPHQPRRNFDETTIRELAESIRQVGLLSPLLVRRTGTGEYELIAGERRLRALQMLNHSLCDAIVLSAFDRDCALIGLMENLEREDLHFLDIAESCSRILHQQGLSRDSLASALSMSPSALANLLRLLRLDAATRSLIRENGLSERHARALLKLQPKDQQRFAQIAFQNQWSVRQLEGSIERHLHSAEKNIPKAEPLIRDNRLVINALRDTVRQLKRIGVRASSRVEDHGDSYDIIVTVRTGEAENISETHG